MTEVLEILGALLLIAGVGLIYVPAALICAGVLCVAASFALDRSPERAKKDRE